MSEGSSLLVLDASALPQHDNYNMKNYKPVIGLEIHVELKTKSKMFCQCSADYFGKAPNSHTCPVCLGLPGALPVPNKTAVEWTILIGKALNCTINKISKFDRKHYFYPDLPKGYQISQYDEPIAIKGWLEVRSPKSRLHQDSGGQAEVKSFKKFGITRVHLEEDTGKLLHQGADTLIDFNRSSVPLVEIVTEPDFDNADDVKIFLEELHTIIRYLDVSNADMEEGSMRLEPNISVREVRSPKSEVDSFELPEYKVEVKNINSFNFVKKAIEYEVKRQTDILEEGKTPAQETRGYDEKKGITYSQRSKEDAQDYRYFPEPDIPPMNFSEEYLASIQKKLPELPQRKKTRYINELSIKPDDAFIITRNIQTADFFETVLSKISKEVPAQTVVNMIINKRIPTDISPEEFVRRVLEQTKPKDTDLQELASVIESVITGNANAVSDFKNGKENSLMFLVGQVMRGMKGKADAVLVKTELRKKLS